MTSWGYSKKKEQAYPKNQKKKSLSKIVGSVTAKNGKTHFAKIKIPQQTGSIDVHHIGGSSDVIINKIGSSVTTNFYKVVGVKAVPQIGRTIPSEYYITTETITQKDQWQGTGFEAKMFLIPKTRLIHQSIYQKIADEHNQTISELKNNEELFTTELLQDGYGIPIGRSKLGNSSNSVANELAKEAESHSTMIGFFLDNPVDHVGTTGWDLLRGFIRGINAKDFARRRMQRKNE